jgi:hypothetical protein
MEEQVLRYAGGTAQETQGAGGGKRSIQAHCS